MPARIKCPVPSPKYAWRILDAVKRLRNAPSGVDERPMLAELFQHYNEWEQRREQCFKQRRRRQ